MMLQSLLILIIAPKSGDVSEKACVTERLQNRAGRIIRFSDYNTRSADILQDLRWETLEQRRTKQLAISVFKSLNTVTFTLRV